MKQSSLHLVIYLLLSSITISVVFTQPIQNENEISESKSKSDELSTNSKNTTNTSTTTTIDSPNLTKGTGTGILRLIKRDVQAEGDESEGKEDESNNSNSGGYEPSNFYPYPMMLSKRSATVLNKLVNALKSSFDQNKGSMRNLDFSREKESSVPSRNNLNYEMFNLQRRNQQKDRKNNYLRCYFNAVSCF